MSTDPSQVILIKYGGNAMTDAEIQHQLLSNICQLISENITPVIVHGGGPFIQEQLDRAGLTSEFIYGQRKTGKEEMKHVQMALRGQVNGELVRMINHMGKPAVGISGKDASFASVRPLKVVKEEDGRSLAYDLGQVGEVTSIDPGLPLLLINGGYIPVINSVCTGPDGQDYNVNADVFAGHLAGALKVSQFIILTDVDGLYKDFGDPSSLYENLTLEEAKSMATAGILKGGMIPKIGACITALENGSKSARIVNGTKPELLLKLGSEEAFGTLIQKES
jgi:acetylglutamate kinase